VTFWWCPSDLWPFDGT